jgi:hypothetical protein
MTTIWPYDNTVKLCMSIGGKREMMGEKGGNKGQLGDHQELL